MRPGRHTPDQLLLVLILTVLGALAATAGVAALAYGMTRPIVPGPDFAARFTPPVSDFYFGQPRKNAAYIASCLSAPVFLLVGCLFWRRAVYRVPSGVIPWLLDGTAALGGLLALWSLSAMSSCPSPPYPNVPPGWFAQVFQGYTALNPARLVFVGAALFLYALFWRRPSRGFATLAFGLLLAFWVGMLPSNFYAPSEVNEDDRFTFHLNTVGDALSQACNGRHFLVDFPDLYGGYVEFLGPILNLFPRHLGFYLLGFGILKTAGPLFWLLAARQVLRHPLALFATGIALMGELILGRYECYYQYTALRIIFPALGLFLAARYFRHPSRRLYAALTLVTALAPLWNLDTGSVLWLSWTATVAIRFFTREGFVPAVKQALIQLGALLGACALFLLYLRLVSGQWPHPALATAFQTLTVANGYFCIPLTLPDTWLLVPVFYAVSLATIIYFHLQKRATWLTDFMLMLTLLGIGLFDYFMGRSAESNLMWCIYPLVLLAGIFADGTASLVAKGRLPRFAWIFLLPVLLISQYWAALGVMGLPDYLSRGFDVVWDWTEEGDSPLRNNVDFIKAHTTRHERIYLLSRQSGVYYYLSDTLCGVEIPGSGELYDRRYMNDLVAAIQGRHLGKIFLDQDFTKDPQVYRPDVIDQLRHVLNDHYTAAQTSSSGALTLYLPK